MAAFDYQTLYKTLETYGQSHVLKYWEDLNDTEKEQLSCQLHDLNWDVLTDWIREYVLIKPEIHIPTDLTPAPYYPLEPGDDKEKSLYQEAYAAGEELLSNGKIAGFTVAGGQGTRLGYDGPKGTFPVSPVKNKPLFQLFAENLLRAKEKYGITIPWYIMTSPLNDADTRKHFEENNFFGLNSDDVMFFPQGTLPAIGFDGKLILKSKSSLALSPDGHGGSLLALTRSGAIADMKKRGIEHLSYWQVDNPLVKMLDPLFIGLHHTTSSEMSSRSLTKTGPFEKLGNFCLTDNKLSVIEYSDLPEELATKTDENGQLMFRAGSPAIHMLKIDFIERITEGGTLKLPLHRAEKKVPCIDANGQTVTPEVPNAVKLEMFIFDALPLSENPLILEADRNEQFGPVKNATGVDSVESSRMLMINRAAKWLEKAGVTVPRNAEGNPCCRIELSPASFLDENDVKTAAERLDPVPANGEIYFE